MKEQDLLSLQNRKIIIDEIMSFQNKERQEKSLRDCEIYAGNIRPYVEEYQKTFFDSTSMAQMPIIATINVTKKIVDSKATIYNELPDRNFTNLTDDQLRVVEKIYAENQSQFPSVNKLYELQAQTHAYVYPESGKIKIKGLKSHNINVIPKEENPEEAMCYILSSFDKSQSKLKTTSSSINMQIGDENDYKAMKRFIFWTENLHFTTDGYGTLLSESTENPLKMIPIVDISSMKDLTYWKMTDSTLSTFCVEFNSALSTLQQIVHLQGFAQAYLQGPESLLPKSITVGPTKVLRLLTDPNTQTEVKFAYAQPGSDLQGARAHIESLLSMYLSSQGLDPKSISPSGESAQKYSSGIERLLASMEKFEASKEAVNTFSEAEAKIFKVIVAELNALNGTEMLSKDYYTSMIPESATMSVQFKRPEASVSELDVLEVIEKKMSLGLISKKGAIAELYNLNEDEAEEKLRMIEDERIARFDSVEIQDQPENQPV